MENEIVKAEYEIIESSSALGALNSSEIDTQIATAHKFPRSITSFKQRALEYATLDEETAASMFYVLPRAGKKIEGPSVRLAEVVAATWGNIRAEAQVIGVDDKFITAMGTCMDLESNYAVRHQVKRRITDRNGKRFNDDMIQVTGNAACAIAYREAVFKVVPRAMVKSVYDASKQASIGKAMTIEKQRQWIIDWFTKAGSSEKEVLKFLEAKTQDDITVDDIITLKGVITAIKDGEVTIQNALKTDAEESSTITDKLGALEQKVEAKKDKPKEETPKKKEEAKPQESSDGEFSW